MSRQLKLSVISVFLIVVFMTSFVVKPMQEASAIAIVDDLIYIIVGLGLIGAGLSFASKEASDAVVNKYIDDNPDYLEATTSAISNNRVLVDVATNGLKQVVDLSDVWFQGIKEWAYQEFVVGENSLNNDIISDTFQIGELIPLSIGGLLNNFDVFWKNSAGTIFYKRSFLVQNNMLYQQDYASYNNGATYSTNGNPIGLAYNISTDLYLKFVTNTSINIGYIYDGTYTSKSYFSASNFIGATMTIPGTTVSGIIGNDILSNPDYDWTNTYTGNKTLSIPLSPSADGSLDIAGEKYKPYFPDLSGLTYGDIANQDVTGQDFPLEEPIQNWWYGAKSWFGGLFDWIGNLLTDLVGSVGEILDWIRGFFGNLVDSIVQALTNFWDTIKDVFIDIKSAVLSIPASISDVLDEKLPSPTIDPGTEPSPGEGFAGISFLGIWHYVSTTLQYIGKFLLLMLAVWSGLPLPLMTMVFGFIVLVIILGVYRRLIG